MPTGEGPLSSAIDTASSCLVAAEQSCLVVIDVQKYFVEKLPAEARSPLVARIAWLVAVAKELAIPVIATVEDLARNGGTVAPLAEVLHDAGAPTFDKHTFGLAGQADILRAVGAAGRRQCVLAGLETDVCVSQSALGLAAQGFEVFAVEDACASPAPDHAAGLRRMQMAGVTLLRTKGLYYEWVRTLLVHRRVQAAAAALRPSDLAL